MDALVRYEREDDGKILVSDLGRVFMSLGLSQVKDHLPLIMEVGKVSKHAQKIDSVRFANAIDSELKRRASSKHAVRVRFLQKIYSLLRAKDFSLFDIFVKLDTSKSHTLSKIEL